MATMKAWLQQIIDFKLRQVLLPAKSHLKVSIDFVGNQSQVFLLSKILFALKKIRMRLDELNQI